MNELTLKIILIILGLAYLVYLYIFDCRQIDDERREMIRLKSLRITQKLSLGVLIILTFTNCFIKDIPNINIFAILIISNIGLEIITKSYFNKTI